MKRKIVLSLLTLSSLLLGACSSGGSATTVKTKDQPSYFGPPAVAPLPPGTTVRKARAATAAEIREHYEKAAAPARAESPPPTVSTKDAPRTALAPWGTIDTSLWHVQMNDRQAFSTKIHHGGKIYTCKVDHYGRVSWHTGRMQRHMSDYSAVPAEVIAQANTNIAAENKIRSFVPAGPLPDSEEVGFVTVNWGSLKKVTAYQAGLLQDDSLNIPQ